MKTARTGLAGRSAAAEAISRAASSARVRNGGMNTGPVNPLASRLASSSPPMLAGLSLAPTSAMEPAGRDRPATFSQDTGLPARPRHPVKITLGEQTAELDHGAVVIAAITSCTNTSNPEVMIAAALLAKKAAERGLAPKPWVKTSLVPGSRVVMDYYDRAGLTPG